MRTTTALLCAVLVCTGLLCAQPISIYDIQFTTEPSGDSPRSGQQVQTGGIVTGINFSGQPIRYFVADRVGGLWSGVLVNDNQNRLLAIGDSVSFTAEVQESSNQTRLRNIVAGSFVLISPSGSVPPASVQSGAVNESTEGVFLELTNAVVISINSSDTSFVVNDGSGTATIGRGWPYSYYPAVNDTLRFVRGIVSFGTGGFVVNPRSDADLGFFGNRPPVFSSVQNFPATPTEFQSDTVVATIFDDESVASAIIYYRFGDSEEFLSTVMYDDGNHRDGAAGDDIWGGVIPAGPARVSCHYYVRATDNSGASATSPADAPISTYEYLIRSSSLSIFDLQYTGNPTGGDSPYNGQAVTVTGIVTGTNFGTNFFMSDPGGGPWSGIFVFAPSFTPALGDCVRASGVVQEFNGITEYSNAVLTRLGTGIIPPPIDIPFGIVADSAEAYEGSLIRIGPCTVSDTQEWPTQFPAFRVTDDDGNQATVVGEASYEYDPVVGDEFTYIIGCLDYFGGHGWEISPRFDADLGYVDRRAPQLVSSEAVGDLSVNIVFNERLSTEGVDNTGLYEIIDQTDPEAPAVPVVAAYIFSTGKILHLDLGAPLEAEHGYRLHIDEVADISENVLNDAVTFFGAYDASDLTPIATIYNDFDRKQDSVVVLRGVVTHMQDVTTSSGSRRISAYIQDESGRGFSLSQTGAAALFPSIIRGNLIQVTGTASQFGGTIQLNNWNENSTSLLAENVELPAAIETQTGNYRLQREIVGTSHEGYFGAGTQVKVTGTIFRVDENIGGGTNIQIDDGSGNLIVRVWDAMNLDSVQLNDQWYRLGDLVGVTCSITGPSSTFSGDFQLLAGYAEDFTSDLPDVLPSEPLVLNVANRPFAPDLGQKVEIFVNAPAAGERRLRVYDLRGQLVKTLLSSLSGGPSIVQWDGKNDLNDIVPLGTYILHFESVKNGKSESTTKPIVIGTKL